MQGHVYFYNILNRINLIGTSLPICTTTLSADLSEVTIDNISPCACFFDNWNDAVIDKVVAANEEDMEPLYLPSKYPNVLLNGTLGGVWFL